MAHNGNGKLAIDRDLSWFKTQSDGTLNNIINGNYQIEDVNIAQSVLLDRMNSKIKELDFRLSMNADKMDSKQIK